MKISLKKKENALILCIILAILLIMSIVPINSDASLKLKKSTSYSVYLGDVDLDGSVTSADSRLILRMANGSEQERILADIDQDGKVTAEDARLALRMSTGLETPIKTNIYVDRFGNITILYKQNDNINKDQSYLGRYNNGKYVTTWNGKKIYGSKQTEDPKLGPNGCGPTSCAIVATSLGLTTTPKGLVNGNKNCYSTSEDIEAYFKSIGLKTERIDWKKEKYVKSIENGKKLIVLVGTAKVYSDYKGRIGSHTLGEGQFHWYTILDYDKKSDKFYVADPYIWNGNSNCGWISFKELIGVYATIAVGK